MDPAIVVRFRPLGPWRIGPATGARDRVDRIFHSDSLFSAVCAGMMRLGLLEEWLDSTVRREGAPEVRFSSCFPYSGDMLFVPPPKALWPPPASAKVRWANAAFIPASAARDLICERPLNDDRWYVDGPSACLLPESAQNQPGPLRIVTRSHAAIDRVAPGSVVVHRTACLEFAEGSGFWTVVLFSGEEARDRWAERIRGVFELLADSGVGGERSLGWGRSARPQFVDGAFPDVLFERPLPEAPASNGEAGQAPAIETVFWLLSLFSPAEGDAIEWRRGNYSLVTRAGRVESPAGSGNPKRLVRMVEEGSVLAAGAEPRGSATDVAPEGFAHPVYRAGFAVTIPIPLRRAERGPSAI